jgi:hypothetical protein
MTSKVYPSSTELKNPSAFSDALIGIKGFFTGAEGFLLGAANFNLHSGHAFASLALRYATLVLNSCPQSEHLNLYIVF